MRKILSPLCLCGLLLAVPALAADWKMDPAGSKLEFIATFEKTAAPGVFKEFDARLRFDPEEAAAGSLDVTVKVTSADMNVADVNKLLNTYKMAVVDGPNGGNVYTVRLAVTGMPKEELARLVKQLQDEKTVTLVGPKSAD